jgi:hypothetical protein
MFPGFEQIIEKKIIKAQKEGKFNDLDGAGKPLKDDELLSIPDDLKIAYRILKNADFLPPEIELKKEIKKTEELLSKTFDLDKKYKIIKKINFLVMKLNMLQNKSTDFEMPQHYLEKLTEKMEY